MTWLECINLARTSVMEGDLESAQRYKQRAEMLHALDMMEAGANIEGTDDKKNEL